MADDTAELRDLSHHLAVAIGRVNRRMRGAGAQALGHGHLSVLGTLATSAPLRLGDLAQREVVSAPSMTRTVTDLEKRGLVRRLSDPEDGRSVLVELTEKGEETVFGARSERAELLAAMIRQLAETEIATLTAALPALERMASPPGGTG
ncbi:MAG: MarR family transcriptional regulator [Micrococcales bacterium]|nr:MarR family transcriptional regulator [Micrococcales bacterium]